jgi:Sortase domain
MNRFAVLRERRLLTGAAVVAVVAIVLVLAMRVVFGSGGGDEAKISGTPTANSAGLLQEAIDQQQQLDPSLLASRGAENGLSGTNPDAPVPGGEGDRLIIPAIDVNASLTMRVVVADENGGAQMANPEGPNDVVWYDFSAFSGLGGRPGVGGNTILSGHVDYHDYGPAVFWDLRKLPEGSEITIHLRDGTDYKYAVRWNRVLDPASTSWNEIVATTSQESLTMITCAGTFDSSTRSYDQRRVVWAVRTG